MAEDKCPEYEQCIDRRTADAEYRGTVLAKLDSIERNINSLWDEMIVNRGDIKSLYFRIGLISGGTSLVVSLVVSVVSSMVK